MTLTSVRGRCGELPSSGPGRPEPSASALPAAVALRRSLRACSLLRPPTLYLIRWEKSNLTGDADASSVNRTASAIASPVTCPSPPGACFTARNDLVLVLGAVGVSFRGYRRTCPCLPEPCPVRLSRLAPQGARCLRAFFRSVSPRPGPVSDLQCPLSAIVRCQATRQVPLRGSVS